MDATTRSSPHPSEGIEDGPPEVVSPGERRREVLAPQLEVVLKFTAQIDPDEVPRVGQLAGHPVELGRWERDTLKRAGSASRARTLLAECLAYQVKGRELHHLFEHGPLPPPAELRSFQDGLVTLVAVGRALMDELQRDLNHLIGHGKLADAKSLSALRTKVAQCTSSLEQRLGASDLEQVQPRVTWLVDAEAEFEADVEVEVEHRPADAVEPSLQEPELEAVGWVRYREAEQAREGELPPWLDGESAPAARRSEITRRDRVKQLLMLLAVVIALYAVVMYPRLSRPPGPPVLTMRQFSHLDVVRGITARPPSLFVRLDAQGWQSRSPAAQRELLAEIGSIVDRAGYSGFRARTTDGITVGQWMKAGGVRLIARPADPS